jgi:hypothetical protein
VQESLWKQWLIRRVTGYGWRRRVPCGGGGGGKIALTDGVAVGLGSQSVSTEEDVEAVLLVRLDGTEMQWRGPAMAKQGGSDRAKQRVARVCGHVGSEMVEVDVCQPSREGISSCPRGAAVSTDGDWCWCRTTRWRGDRMATVHMVGAGGTGTGPAVKRKNRPLHVARPEFKLFFYFISFQTLKFKIETFPVPTNIQTFHEPSFEHGEQLSQLGQIQIHRNLPSAHKYSNFS